MAEEFSMNKWNEKVIFISMSLYFVVSNKFPAKMSAREDQSWWKRRKLPVQNRSLSPSLIRKTEIKSDKDENKKTWAAFPSDAAVFSNKIGMKNKNLRWVFPKFFL